MATYLFANNAKSTLASGITNVATTLFVQTGDGAKFPSPAAGEHFTLTISDSAGNMEIVYCTLRTVDAFFITRGEEGTIPFPFAQGDEIALRLTAGTLGALPQKNGALQVDLNADKWDGADKIVSTSAPSAGNDGDIWLQY